jgi:hypothetical protein
MTEPPKPVNTVHHASQPDAAETRAYWTPERKAQMSVDYVASVALAETILGLSTSEAEQRVIDAGRWWVVIRPDETFLTADFAPTRIRVWVTDGIVTKAEAG